MRASRWVLLAVAIVAAVLFGVAQMTAGRLRDMLFFTAGGFCWMLVWLYEDLPSPLARLRDGLEGERRTAARLRRLSRRGWRCFHDLLVPGLAGNIDHVLIGPAGVMVVDSKNWSGTLTVLADGGVSSVRAHQPDRAHVLDVASAVTTQALALRHHLQRGVGRRVRVLPVVAFWGAFPQGRVEHDDVLYVRGAELNRALLERPVIVPEYDEERVVAELERLEQSSREVVQRQFAATER